MPGTELEFIPEAVANGWRVLFLVVLALTLGKLAVLYPARSRALPGWAAWGHAAIALILVRTAVVTVERIDTPVTLEGLPVNTAFVLLIWRECLAFERVVERRPPRSDRRAAC